MATTLFDIAAECLEQGTDMDRLATRGTLRIALKSAGLAVSNLTVRQLQVVFEKILPGELETRGVPDAAGTCSRVIDRIVRAASAVDIAESSDPDDVFRRLGSD